MRAQRIRGVDLEACAITAIPGGAEDPPLAGKMGWCGFGFFWKTTFSTSDEKST